MITCQKCKGQNVENAQFCTSCGNPLLPPVAMPTENNQTAPPKRMSPLLPALGGFLIAGPLGAVSCFLIARTSWEKKKKIIALIAAIVISVLIQIFILMFAGLSSSNKSASNDAIAQPTIAPTTQTASHFNSVSPTQSVQAIRDQTDTDGDGIPDWVEAGVGLNPNKDECQPDLSQCQASFGVSDNRPKNILVILDDSGSMAEKLSDGSTKIDVAKNDIQNLLTVVPIDTNVSLMVYGSRGSNSPNDKELSCSAIDILYPLGMANKDKITQSLATFTPTGWTPIAASFDKAREVFAGHEQEKNYILLASDGEETCGGDPLRSVTALRQFFPNLTVDVAGLNVSGNEKTQLEQIAQAGGGKFYDVRQKSDFDQILVWEHNVWQYTNLLSCLEHTSLNFNTCQQKEYTKVADYLTKLAVQKSNAGDQQVSRQYFDLIQQILRKQIARNDAFLNFMDGIRQSTKQYTNQ